VKAEPRRLLKLEIRIRAMLTVIRRTAVVFLCCLNLLIFGIRSFSLNGQLDLARMTASLCGREGNLTSGKHDH
jgi:hypothetical protein